MATWAELAAAAPKLAASGRELLYRNGDGEGLLATVRGEGLPRVNPINAGIVGGRLYTFVIGGSAKRRDLESDGRYALHTHVDPASPSEFSIRGRARPVEGGPTRSAVATEWFFTVDDSYVLFELDVAHALLGERHTADEWPPRYTSWSAPG
jgi:hypothetical protein